jgi:hypothetical protein
MKNPCEKLIEGFDGRRINVALHFGITREAVRIWTIRGIPEDRALDVEELTDGEITAREILEFARLYKKRAL